MLPIQEKKDPKLSCCHLLQKLGRQIADLQPGNQVDNFYKLPQYFKKPDNITRLSVLITYYLELSVLCKMYKTLDIPDAKVFELRPDTFLFIFSYQQTFLRTLTASHQLRLQFDQRRHSELPTNSVKSPNFILGDLTLTQIPIHETFLLGQSPQGTKT